MQTYRITTVNWEGYKDFESPEAAEAHAISLGFETYTVEPVTLDAETMSLVLDEEIDRRFAFGQYLLKLFIKDNRVYELDNNTSITPQQSGVLTQKLQVVMAYAGVGAIADIAAILPSIPVDIATDPIFTQERKDKYQLIISEYLQNI